MPIKDVKDGKSYSPFHSNRPQQQNNVTMGNPTSSQYIPHRPVSQANNPNNHMNKTLINPQGKVPMAGLPGQSESFGINNVTHFNQNKQNGGFNGFGRFS